MIRYMQIESPSEQELEFIVNLEKEIFEGRRTPIDFKKRTQGKKNILADFAYDDQKIVGFKLGYEHSSEIFYSWLGGVLPSHRRHGIAAELLRQQHLKVQALGYKGIRTNSRNHYSSMMILNLKNGFRIVGTQYRGSEKDIAIIFEKVF